MKYNMSKAMLIVLAIAFSTSASAQQTTENGIKMYNYKKWESAEKILEPLAATDPKANYYLGLCYLESGNPAQANTLFLKYPEDPANISGTARVAFVNKNVAKGMQIAKDLAAKSKKKEWQQEKYAADAIAYTTGGDYQQAVSWYKDVLTKTDDADVHINLGDVYRKIPGGAGNGMDNYEHVTEKDPKNSLAFSRIGDTWYESANYPSALDNYDRAKDADPTNPLPYKSLADAYYRSGNYQKALENMKKYMELSDNTPADQYYEAGLLYQARNYCDAVTLSKKLLLQQTEPAKKTELYGILGFSQAECGDSTEALKNIRMYLQMQLPSKITPDAYIQFGKLFMKLGMLDSAAFYYTKGINGDTAKNKTDHYREIAEAFKVRKDYCKSAEWYNNLIQANPATQPLDYFWRGCMYYYCTNYTSALKAFNDFENKYPDQNPAIYWEGRAAAVIDSEAKEGTAVPYFTKWLDKVGPNYEKKNDLKIAYEYLLFYYYHKKDKENIKAYEDKIRIIDPNDSLLKQIEEAEKAESAPKKTTKAKGK
jgi:tetratricopeptide (TPR) repeat protein